MIKPRALVTALLLSTAPAAASPGSTSTPAAPPSSAAKADLLELRAQLAAAGRATAQAQLPKFRPLCDKDGYPLVGNLASKGDVYQPSQFCAELRTREPKR
jgi:hypothetical protein